MTPRDLLLSLAEGAAWFGRDRRKGRPGEVIERLSPESRAILKELRSSDVTFGPAHREAPYMGVESNEERSKAFRKDLLLQFDRDVLRLS